MKTAVGIIGIGLGLIVLMQSCTITGLSGMIDEKETSEAGSLGMLTALLMFFGGAFSFGLPRVAAVVFALGFLISIPARDAFPDMWVWGIVSLILGVLIRLSYQRDKRAKTVQ